MTPEEAIDHYIPQMQGWSTPEKCKTLYRCIKQAQGNSLEIGIFGGRALLSMGFAHREVGGLAIGLDPWEKAACLEGENAQENDAWWTSQDLEMIQQGFVEAVFAHRLSQWVRWHRLTSKQALTFLKESFAPFGVIHQDGNHSEQVSSWEVDAYAPLLKSGGYWVMDDTNWNTTAKAQQKILSLGFKELEDHKEWKLYQKA